MEFPSLQALGEHALSMDGKTLSALSLGVYNAARTIHSATRKMFGHYQDGDGPFGSWPELADATKEERVREGYSANEPLLRSGTLMRSYELAAGPRGSFSAGVGSPLPQALGQEIGIPGHNVPARSTLGIAFVKSERKGFGKLSAMIGATLMYSGTAVQFTQDFESLDEAEVAQDETEQLALGSML